MSHESTVQESFKHLSFIIGPILILSSYFLSLMNLIDLNLLYLKVNSSSSTSTDIYSYFYMYNTIRGPYFSGFYIQTLFLFLIILSFTAGLQFTNYTFHNKSLFLQFFNLILWTIYFAIALIPYWIIFSFNRVPSTTNIIVMALLLWFS